MAFGRAKRGEKDEGVRQAVRFAERDYAGLFRRVIIAGVDLGVVLLIWFGVLTAGCLRSRPSKRCATSGPARSSFGDAPSPSAGHGSRTTASASWASS